MRTSHHAAKHPEHLNTPRLVANDQQQTVWRWDQQEPFGANACNPDPDGDSVEFEFNLRFPGQYFDRETNQHYNYFRDYDPSLGRYVQSDPIGLLGGINTYSYAKGNSLSKIDPKGLLDCFVRGDCYEQAGANYRNCTATFNPNVACAIAFARCIVVARSPGLLRVCVASAIASCAAAQAVCVNQLFADQRNCDQGQSIDGYIFGEHYGEGPDCKCYSRPQHRSQSGS